MPIQINSYMVGCKRAVVFEGVLHVSPAMYRLMEDATPEELEQLLRAIDVLDLGQVAGGNFLAGMLKQQVATRRDRAMNSEPNEQYRDPSQPPPQPAPQPYVQPYMPPPQQQNASMNVTVQNYRPFNHVLHLLLTIMTCGMWAPIWFLCWLFR